MENNNNHKPVTLDDLAVMVADGFGDIGGRIDKVESRMEKVEGKIDKLESSVSGLRSSVNHYLDLSNERYLELKHRDILIVNWLKAIGDKTGVPIDVSQLEKVI